VWREKIKVSARNHHLETGTSWQPQLTPSCSEESQIIHLNFCSAGISPLSPWGFLLLFVGCPSLYTEFSGSSTSSNIISWSNKRCYFTLWALLTLLGSYLSKSGLGIPPGTLDTGNFVDLDCDTLGIASSRQKRHTKMHAKITFLLEVWFYRHYWNCFFLTLTTEAVSRCHDEKRCFLVEKMRSRLLVNKCTSCQIVNKLINL